MSRQDSTSPAALAPADRHRSLILKPVLLALAGGVLMGLPWVDQALYWTAWIGSVPLLLALRRSSLPFALLLGVVNGVAYFAIASYWIVEFLTHLRELSLPLAILFGLLFWCYAGFAVGLSCLLFRWLSRLIPAWDLLSFPVCMLLIMSHYPLLFGVYYGEAQARFLPALQGVSLLGVQALDLIMLMTSVLLVQLLLDRRRAARVGNLIGTTVLVLWFTYGFIALQQWDQRIQGWDLRPVGLVQPNDAVTLEVPEPPSGYSREHPRELAVTERLAAAGAELVVWPEARYKGYFDRFSVRLNYAQVLRERGTDLILHDAERAWDNGEAVNYNSLVHLGADGEQRGLYRKMVLMPFGEYLPGFFQLPGVGWLTSTFFGEFLRPLRPGIEHRVFDVNGMQVVPKVCYETAFPRFIAASIGADAAGKVLLFVSQDNWFGETRQPFQHSAMSVVRGVENRVPMIHLINNGPSVVAAPNGRIHGRTDAFQRQELLVHMPFSAESGGSFFSRHPGLLSSVLYASMAAMLLIAYRRQLRGQTNCPAL